MIEVGDTVERIKAVHKELVIGDRVVVDKIFKEGPFKGNFTAKGIPIVNTFNLAYFKKVKGAEMKKPENKAEALQMIEELKSYVENMDKPVWNAHLVQSGTDMISAGGRGCLLVAEHLGSRYNIISSGPSGELCFIELKTPLDSNDMADYLNENGFQKA